MRRTWTKCFTQLTKSTICSKVFYELREKAYLQMYNNERTSMKKQKKLGQNGGDLLKSFPDSDGSPPRPYKDI